MPNLFTVVTKKDSDERIVSEIDVFSVAYHDIFDYPLSVFELIKWQAGKNALSSAAVVKKNGYYFLEGKEAILYKRQLRERISAKKLLIAKRASRVLSFIPTVKLIAVTGSLAMENSVDESDIDLMVIAQKGFLWTTRLLCYAAIGLYGFKIRKPNSRDQKNKLCLNMWLDESDLKWRKKDRNFYTAHEIAQIVPLVNKDKTYERFLWNNHWILKFWPNSIKIGNWKLEIGNFRQSLLEKICYQVQRWHMKNKISREVISPSRALFHPQDWGKVVMGRLTS